MSAHHHSLMRDRLVEALLRWASRRIGQPRGLRFALPGGVVNDDELRLDQPVALVAARREPREFHSEADVGRGSAGAKQGER